MSEHEPLPYTQEITFIRTAILSGLGKETLRQYSYAMQEKALVPEADLRRLRQAYDYLLRNLVNAADAAGGSIINTLPGAVDREMIGYLGLLLDEPDIASGQSTSAEAIRAYQAKLNMPSTEISPDVDPLIRAALVGALMSANEALLTDVNTRHEITRMRSLDYYVDNIAGAIARLY